MGTARAVPVDFRLIAATNTDLTSLVRLKRFREDLFYRLSEFTIHLPALRERKEDISFLATRFCDEACEELKKKPLEIDDGAMELLMQCSWPGNVRELKNVMRRAVLLSSGGTLDRNRLTEVLEGAFDHGAAGFIQREACSSVLPLKEVSSRAVTDAETATIRQALTLSKGNKSKAASILRVDYKTLLTKIRQYGI